MRLKQFIDESLVKIVTDPYIYDFPELKNITVFVNPSAVELGKIIKENTRDLNYLRYTDNVKNGVRLLIDFKKKKIYTWSGTCIHEPVMTQLGYINKRGLSDSIVIKKQIIGLIGKISNGKIVDVTTDWRLEKNTIDFFKTINYDWVRYLLPDLNLIKIILDREYKY